MRQTLYTGDKKQQRADAEGTMYAKTLKTDRKKQMAGRKRKQTADKKDK
jgi:hypothetical protein